MRLVLQHQLPVLPWMDPLAARLPGVQPCPPDQWLKRDEAFPGQMAYRDELIAAQRDDVLQGEIDGDDATRLLAAVLDLVGRDKSYQRHGDTIIRPDGVAVDLGADAPLALAGRLVQQDLLLLAPAGGEHRLVAACVCFPASWTLRQKIGRPMTAIHGPVDRYDESIAKRTERILMSLREGEPVWRANVLPYNDPELRQPRREGEHRSFDPAKPTFIRVERQTLLRLSPSSIAFAIHTAIVPREAVPAEAIEALQTTPFWAART